MANFTARALAQSDPEAVNVIGAPGGSDAVTSELTVKAVVRCDHLTGAVAVTNPVTGAVANYAAGDTVQITPLDDGMVVTNVVMRVETAAPNAAANVQVGTEHDPDRYITAAQGTLNAVGGKQRVTANFPHYAGASDNELRLTFAGTAAQLGSCVFVVAASIVDLTAAESLGGYGV